MKERKIPKRTCVVTNEQYPKWELIRVLRTPENEVKIDDERGKSNGHGAYLKKDIEVIEKARKSKVLEKKLELKVPDRIYDELISIVNNK